MWAKVRPTATLPDAAFSHVPHDCQIRGMGLKAATQQLQRRTLTQQQQPTQMHLQCSGMRQAVVSQAVLERHPERAAVTGAPPTQACYIAGQQQDTQQQLTNNRQQLQQLQTAGGFNSRHPTLLQPPSRGCLAWKLTLPGDAQQQQQQQQQQETGAPHGSTEASELSAVGAPEPQREQLLQDIAAATTLQQLQQLFPHIAAAGLPELTTVLLLQTVRVVRSGQPSRMCWSLNSSSNWQQHGLQIRAQLHHQQQQHLLQEQQDQQHQQQQRQQVLDQELQQLLQNVNLLLGRQCQLLQFQHISGVLWAWSQLGWRPAQDKASGIGLRDLLRRLTACPVQREQSGRVSQVGPQLARAIVGCATLNIQDPFVWQKLHRIAQGAAAVLQPRELALCAWGMARSRTPHTPLSIAAWTALLQRAQGAQAAADAGGFVGLGFDRVGALNLSWAMVAARVSYLAPASFLQGLLQTALGPGYQSWQQQQARVQAQGRQQQQELGPISAAAAAAAAAADRGVDSTVTCGLLPQELCSLLWTLATISKQQQKITAASTMRQQKQQQPGWETQAATPGPRQHNQQQQQQQPRSKRQQVDERAQEQFTPQQRQQQEQLQDNWGREMQAVLQDHQLHGYLSAAVQGQLQELQLPYLAQLAHTAAMLHRDSMAWPQTAPSTAAAVQQKQLDSSHTISCIEGLGVYDTLVQQTWGRVLQINNSDSQGLQGLQLGEVCLLLQSVAALQQQQQQQQQSQAAVANVAAAADIVAAAVRRIQSAAPSELPACTAVLLLHHMAVLGRVTAGSHAVMRQAVQAAAAAVTVRLVHAICVPGGTNCLRDSELVLAAVAAGQLAAVAEAAAGANNSSSSSSSGSTGGGGRQGRALQLLLQQLTLPLAAVAPNLKLRSLANVACAYAALGLQPQVLFDAVADSVQKARVLDHGSSWALARTLAAYAAVEYVDEGLFGAVADALTPRLRSGTLRPRVLSKFAGALAVVGFHDRAVFRDIAATVTAAAAPAAGGSKGAVTLPPPAAAAAVAEDVGEPPVLPYYQPQDVSNLAWALATAGFRDPKPFLVLAAAGVQLLSHMSTSQVANLLWGCAVAGVRHEPLLRAVVSQWTAQPQQQQQQQQQGPQSQQQHWQQGTSMLAAASASEVASIAWSLSTMQVHAPSVYAACAQHYMLCARQYSPADAADLAWALAWHGPPCITQLVAAGLSAKPQQQQQQQQQQLAGHHYAEAETDPQHNTSSSSGGGSRTSSSSTSSGGSSEHVGQSVQLRDVLQQLLLVCDADIDALSPQQLASMVLVNAALQAGCVPVGHKYSHSSSSSSSSRGSRGSSSGGGGDEVVGVSSSSSGSSSRDVSGVLGDAWSYVAAWGPAFSAAEGAQLLWAHLLPEQGAQQRQQLVESKDGTSSAGVRGAAAKLLASGARATVHQTAAVCGSNFCQEALAALQGVNFSAHPCIAQQQQQPSARARPLTGRTAAAATAAAAAAVAAAVTAAVVTSQSCTMSASADSNTDPANNTSSCSSSSGSEGSIWQYLDPTCTAQLLGHIVLDLPVQHGSRSAGSDTVKLLLHLVPHADLCQPVGSVMTDQDRSTAQHGGAGQTDDVQDVQLGWRGVVGAQVLRQQPHFVGVVLTQQQWEAWGDQQAQKLQELVTGALSAD